MNRIVIFLPLFISPESSIIIFLLVFNLSIFVFGFGLIRTILRHNIITITQDTLLTP